MFLGAAPVFLRYCCRPNNPEAVADALVRVSFRMARLPASGLFAFADS